MASRHKAAAPVKLGLDDNPYSNNVFGDKTPSNRGSNAMLIAGIVVALALLGGVGAGIAVATIPSESNSVELTAAPTTGSPSTAPTDSPTEAPTLPVPSVSPTAYPTRSPSPPTSASPTQSPVPTVSLPCTNPDAICGCDLIQSELIDILWIVDESGSIDNNDFLAVQAGVTEFVNDTKTVGEYGSRFGWIQFNEEVNPDIIDLTEYLDKEGLKAAIELRAQRKGGTNQKASLIEALSYFQKPENSIRNFSQTVIIMLTDGAPCTLRGLPGIYDPRGALRDIADYFKEIEQNFTFFYLPIGDNVELELFDSEREGDVDITYCGPYDNDLTPNFVTLVKTDTGLVEGETFIKLPIGDFPLLDETLKTELEIPLGPCITPPPTVTG